MRSARAMVVRRSSFVDSRISTRAAASVRFPLSSGAGSRLGSRMNRVSIRERRAALSALGFLLPNLLGFLAFTLFPVLFSLWMAFTNWSLKPAVRFEFVGFRNFIDLLGLRAAERGNSPLLTA